MSESSSRRSRSSARSTAFSASGGGDADGARSGERLAPPCPSGETGPRTVDERAGAGTCLDDGAGAGACCGECKVLAGMRCVCPPPGMASRAAARATEVALWPTEVEAELELELAGMLGGGQAAADAGGGAETVDDCGRREEMGAAGLLTLEAEAAGALTGATRGTRGAAAGGSFLLLIGLGW